MCFLRCVVCVFFEVCVFFGVCVFGVCVCVCIGRLLLRPKCQHLGQRFLLLRPMLLGPMSLRPEKVPKHECHFSQFFEG